MRTGEDILINSPLVPSYEKGRPGRIYQYNTHSISFFYKILLIQCVPFYRVVIFTKNAYWFYTVIGAKHAFKKTIS
jgi:hypothetical protein